jgi:Dockerin type I domain
MLSQTIDKADRVTLSIRIPRTDTFTGRLNVLPGDVNDYSVVNSNDITTIRNERKGTHGAQPTIFGDILGNGTVNAADYDAARRFEGITLPKLPKTGGKPPKGVLVRALARQHDDLNPRHRR